jgi:hypothetical protein
MTIPCDRFEPDMAFLTEEEATTQVNNVEMQDISVEEDISARGEFGMAEEVGLREDGGIREDVERREVGEHSTVTRESWPGAHRAGADRWLVSAHTLDGARTSQLRRSASRHGNANHGTFLAGSQLMLTILRSQQQMRHTRTSTTTTVTETGTSTGLSGAVNAARSSVIRIIIVFSGQSLGQNTTPGFPERSWTRRWLWTDIYISDVTGSRIACIIPSKYNTCLDI